MTTPGRGWDNATAVLDSAPVGITLVDTDGSLVSVNDRFLDLTGYDRATLLDRRYGELLGPDTSEAAIEKAEHARTNAVEATVELQVQRDDGTTFWDRVRLKPVRSESGVPDGVAMFHEDITTQRSQSRSLESLNRFAGRVQTADSVDAVCERTVTAAADILDFDMCSILLKDGEWLVPRATSSDAPPDGSRRMRLDQGLAGLTYQTGTSQVADDLGRDGDADPAKEIYQSGISVPVNGHGVFQAVTTEVESFDANDLELAELLGSHAATAIERVKQERDLAQQNQRLDEFADVVSHDLRSPLSVLKGSLNLARQTGDDEHFERAVRATERMTQLIDNLLALARRGDDIGELHAVALARVARAAWSHVATDGADLSVDTDLVVMANEARLTQLLENLFRNSVEHGSTDGRTRASHDGDGLTDEPDADPLQVRVGTLDDATGFYVSDDGVGIPADEREQVVESGYSTADGTGLGLTISKRVVEAHGWTMTLTDGRDGGARFEMSGVDLATE